MKIAIHSGEIPSTTFIERLILGLAENGVEVLLHGHISEPVKYQSKKIKVIGYSGRLSKLKVFVKYFLMLAFLNPGLLKKLFKLYRKKTPSRSFSLWFLKVAPIIWHKPDVFHLQWTKGIEDWIFLKQFGIKVVVSLRGSQINYSPIVEEKTADSYARNFPHVDLFQGVSREICREAQKYGAGEEKCRVVYSGLKLDDFTFQQEKKFNRAKLKIVSVGRSHWVKNYAPAIEAMRLLKDAEINFDYTIIGGKSQELDFEIDDLDLNGQVRLTQNVPFEQVKTQIANADILLLTSVAEGIPNVVLEAMALGTIVISTECGGVIEVIKDGENGFLVPLRDAASIVEKVFELINLPDEKIGQIRRKARQTFETQHNHQKMVTDMKNLYLSLLTEKMPDSILSSREFDSANTKFNHQYE